MRYSVRPFLPLPEGIRLWPGRAACTRISDPLREVACVFLPKGPGAGAAAGFFPAGFDRSGTIGAEGRVAMLGERHRIALEMRAGGATYQAIGDLFGVSASRASAIHQRAVILRTESQVGLRMRSIKILREFPPGLEALATMVTEDRQTAFLTLLRQPDCGRWQAEEILAWLDAGNRVLP